MSILNSEHKDTLDPLVRNYDGLLLASADNEYDHVSRKLGYIAPAVLARNATQLAGKTVLDLACGTGFVGKAFHDAGQDLLAIDGVDSSTYMLGFAQDAGYRRLILGDLRHPEQFENHLGTYDGLTCCGFLGNATTGNAAVVLPYTRFLRSTAIIAFTLGYMEHRKTWKPCWRELERELIPSLQAQRFTIETWSEDGNSFNNTGWRYRFLVGSRK